LKYSSLWIDLGGSPQSVVSRAYYHPPWLILSWAYHRNSDRIRLSYNLLHGRHDVYGIVPHYRPGCCLGGIRKPTRYSTYIDDAVHVPSSFIIVWLCIGG
jgi:hypothetical protein